ncbi:MAG: aromatic amino acid hydroxylase [bacterium]|nr:aromatic amino acid hydroxylase [bacterium]
MSNEVISKLPDHLKQYMVDQSYESYTSVDHAVWRYVMRQSRYFLEEHAHEIYLEGLHQSGLETEVIPSIEKMNKILSRIGWAAVPVNGFIPPSAFMEFQAHRVLVIAADMRQLNHIEYTPSPDIIHEAAGHAPIIASPEYAEYLRLFGEVGSKAMSSRKDLELYEAIRKLSILKETPGIPQEEIDEAEKAVLEKQKNLGEPSEMALLTRLHWWTVEYGLVGDVKKPRIYGAGLLSSIGEAESCLKENVKKIPYSLNTVDYAFDITTKQPQLFVTPNFRYLIDVLQRFSETMVFKKGGLEGINKAIECSNTCTVVYSSGLQVSGVFSEVSIDDWNRPVYIKTTGRTNLAYEHRELEGHGTDYHKEGFSSPVGLLKKCTAPLEELSDEQLKELGIVQGKPVELVFESGIMVDGRLGGVTRKNGKIILMTFNKCLVTYRDKVLFDPSWGTFDMAVGEKIASVFAGAADKDAFEQLSRVSGTRTMKVDYSEAALELHRLYQKVRDYRESGSTDHALLQDVWSIVRKDYADEWLLPIELLELLEEKKLFPETKHEIKQRLKKLCVERSECAKLIKDGLNLIYSEDQ